MSRNTKANRAHVIIERVQIGPSFDMTFIGSDVPELANIDANARLKLGEAIRHQYQLWATSWVLPELRELLPK